MTGPISLFSEILTVSCTMLENGQTNFKNLAVRTHLTLCNIMQHATLLTPHNVQHGIKHYAW